MRSITIMLALGVFAVLAISGAAMLLNHPTGAEPADDTQLCSSEDRSAGATDTLPDCDCHQQCDGASTTKSTDCPQATPNVGVDPEAIPDPNTQSPKPLPVEGVPPR